MEFQLTTPALLFPAISLLLLAYTNRFLALAAVIRKLHDEYVKTSDASRLVQISSLHRRVHLVQNMQFLGVLSLLLCTVCMFLIFMGLIISAEVVFTLALLAMIFSLVLSLMEIHISVQALDLHLRDLEK